MHRDRGPLDIRNYSEQKKSQEIRQLNDQFRWQSRSITLTHTHTHKSWSFCGEAIERKRWRRRKNRKRFIHGICRHYTCISVCTGARVCVCVNR